MRARVILQPSATPVRRYFMRSKRFAGFVFLLLALAWAGPAAAQVKRGDDRYTYEHIVDRVRAGQDYYTATAIELRAGNFPLKPALAFRPPTLAWILALLPGTVARLAALYALLACTVIAWMRKLNDRPAGERIAMIALLMCGLANAGGPSAAYFHEVWAAVLTALSLALWPRLLPCLAFALLAVLVRETAIVFVAAMGMVSLLARDWRRAAGCIAIAILCGGLWLWHARMAQAVTLPGDPGSPGWLAFSGMHLILQASRWNLLTSQLPDLLLVPALALMAYGLSLAKTPDMRTAGLTVALFWIAMLAVGRVDNNYWGIMYSPFMALGLPNLFRELRGRIATGSSLQARQRQ